MREIKQEEFENYIRDIIKGNRSKASVIKELQTESRTFNNKIQELSAINPKLYKEFIAVHPYRPKERKDINIHGFVIEMLKSDFTLTEMCEKYNVSYRTISRKITRLKKSDNPEDLELYELYKSIASKRSTSRKPSLGERNKIDQLERQEVKGISDVERRKQKLLELEKQYQDLSIQFGKEEAAKRLGYTQNRIYKLLNELYRIEIEEHMRKKDTEEDKGFRDRIKVESTTLGNSTSIIMKENNELKTGNGTEGKEQEER